MGFRDLIEEELKKKEQERQIEEQKRQITQEISIANEQRKNNILPTSRERRSSEILPRASERRTYLVREKKKLSKEVSEKNKTEDNSKQDSKTKDSSNIVTKVSNPIVEMPMIGPTKNKEDTNDYKITNNIVEKTPIKYIDPSRFGTVEDLKATLEAKKIEEDMSKGDYNSAISLVANSFLEGAKSGIAGIGNAILIPVAGGLQKYGDIIEKTGIINNENNALNNASEALLDASDYLEKNSTYLSKVNSNLDNGVLKTAGSVTNALGNMLPSIMANFVVPGSGLITTGISAGGRSAQETINEDRDNIGEAITTGVLKGGLEALTEKITGGNILAKGTSLDNLVTKGISNKVKSNVGQMLLSKGYEFGGEIAEEIISDTGGNLVDKIVNGKDMPSLKEWWENSGETAKTTFLTTAVLQALGLGGGTYNDVKQLNLNKQQEAEAQSWISEAENIIKNTSGEQNNQKGDPISRNDIVRQMNEESLPVKNEQFRYANRAYEESARKYNIDTDNETVKSINRVAQERGINVTYNADLFDNANTDAIWRSNADGTREVILNPNADTNKTLESVITHELAHDLEGTNEYNELRDLILNYNENKTDYAEARKSLEELYSKVYDRNSIEFETLVDNEVVADILGNKLGNQEFINNLTTEKPTLGRRIYNWVVDKLNKINKATGYKSEKIFWTDVKNKFENAYKQDYQGVNASDMLKFSINSNFKQEYDSWNKIDRQGSFLIGKTSDALKSIGLDDYDIVMDKSKILKIKNDHPEMSDDIIKSIPEILENPTLILNSQSNNVKAEGRKVIFGEILDTKGNPVLVALELNPYENKNNIDKIYKVASAYGKENLNTIQNWINNPKNVLYIDRHKNRTINWLNGLGLQLPVPNNSSSSTNSIPPSGEDVNTTTKYSMQESENNSGSFSVQDNQGKKLSKRQQERYKNVSSKLKDENGNLKRYYHGTQRSDRVGNYFDPERATSGPMAFFTDNQDIAKNYSENKQDTSISREANTEYDLFKVNGKNLDDYWNSLSKEQQSKIAQEGYNIGLDEDFENIVHEKGASKNSFSTQYDYYLNHEEKGNAIKALYDVFIQDGNLMFEDMVKFQDVLKYAGVQNVEYLDQYTTSPKVYEVYLNITNPFDTSEISSDIVQKLRNKARTIDNEILGYSADQWDKSNITPEQWIARLEDDIKNGTTHAWTSIPDWVTDVLKENGYDGIVDTGGKNGGEEHQVVIPFYSNQIKNVDNTNPTDNLDIRYSQNNNNWQSFLDQNYKNTGTGQTIQEVKIAPTANNNNLETGKYTRDQENQKKQKIEEDKIAQILEKPLEETKEKDRKWAILKANLVDKGIVFEELSHKTKNRELQGKWDYTLTANARGQNAIGQARYEMNQKTKTEKQICKSLEDIRTEVGSQVNEFQQYMYHQLNIDRMTLEERFSGDTGINYERKNDIKNKPVLGDSVTAEVSREIVRDYEKRYPQFKEWAKDVYDFNNANKQELVKNGVISQELSDRLGEMYPHYVPIKRVDAKGNAIKVPLDTNRTGINAPLARAKGGNSDIQPLFQTMADRTLQTYRASARNNFGVELMNTLNTIQNVQKTDIDTILEEVGNVDSDVEFLKEGKNGESPTFTVFDNGEKVTFEITKDMYDALKPVNDSSILSKTFKTLNKISNIRRGVLTEYNPLFLITNAIKDAQEVLGNSQHSLKTYSKFPEAYAQITSKGYWYKEYIRNGGEQNSYFKDGNFESDKKVNIAKKAVMIPLEKISDINNIIEMAPRLAEYIASREKGVSIETSMLDAARVTTNFKAGGDIVKFINRNGGTFLNASVQGASQQIRNIVEAHTKGLKGYAVLATKYAIAGIPALILNNLIWDDDEDYDELQDYVKDNYYIIGKYGDGKFIRIPKGRTVSVIQKIVNNVSEYINKDKEINIDNLAKDFWEGISFASDNLAPNNPIDNNVISPIIQVITNKSWYGEDIVPSRLQNKPNAEQYDETIDSFSIWLGEKLNQSPYKINYLLDQYGGGIADVVLPSLTKQAENNMVEDKFTTDSVIKSKYPGEFYTKLDELTVKNNSDKATDEDKIKYKYFSSRSKEMSDLYKEKREVQSSDLPDEEKKKQIRTIQNKINQIAKTGLEQVDNLEVSKDTAQIGTEQYYKDGKGKWNVLDEEEIQKNSNISISAYADYKQKVYTQTQQKKQSGELKENQDLKDKDKIQILLDSNYEITEKQSLYENYILDNQDKKYSIIKEAGINIQEYLKYKLQDFSADKKDDGTVSGKSISGSSKQKRYNYIMSMENVSNTQKLILFALEYEPSSNNEKQRIINFVTNLNKSNEEKLEIIGQFKGVTVYKNGTFNY